MMLRIAEDYETLRGAPNNGPGMNVDDGSPPTLAKAVWPTNLILTIPNTGATARNKSALSLIRSAIKRLGTQSYGSWQTTNSLLLGRKNEPSDSFWARLR